MMKSALVRLLLGLVAVGAWPAVALADEVKNPGPTNFYLVGDPEPGFRSELYIRQELFRVFLDEPAVFFGDKKRGYVDADGNLFVGAEQTNFSEFFYDTIVGPVGLLFVPLTDVQGSVLPGSGEAGFSLSIETRLRHNLFGENCKIPAVDISVSTSTEDGVPYETKYGSFIAADRTLAIPGAVDCNGFEGAINSSLGLPSKSGNNRLLLAGFTDPVLLPGG